MFCFDPSELNLYRTHATRNARMCHDNLNYKLHYRKKCKSKFFILAFDLIYKLNKF